MITQSPYVFSWGIVFVVLGAVWYVLDHRLGTGIYRWFYDMTHEHPLPASVTRGFIYGQRSSARFGAAVLLSLLQSALAVGRADMNPLLEIVTFMIEVPALMVGFFIGPYLDRIWGRREDLFEKIDEIESGETSVAEEVSGVTGRLKNALFGWSAIRRGRALLGRSPSPAPAIVTSAHPPAPASGVSAATDAQAAEPPQPDENGQDPRELMSRYLNRD